jgi:hypothetical protein
MGSDTYCTNSNCLVRSVCLCAKQDRHDKRKIYGQGQYYAPCPDLRTNQCVDSTVKVS